MMIFFVILLDKPLFNKAVIWVVSVSVFHFPVQKYQSSYRSQEPTRRKIDWNSSGFDGKRLVTWFTFQAITFFSCTEPIPGPQVHGKLLQSNVSYHHRAKVTRAYFTGCTPVAQCGEWEWQIKRILNENQILHCFRSVLWCVPGLLLLLCCAGFFTATFSILPYVSHFIFLEGLVPISPVFENRNSMAATNAAAPVF